MATTFLVGDIGPTPRSTLLILAALFKYAQEKTFAIPAIVSMQCPYHTNRLHAPQNVTSSSTVVASLEAARDAGAPIILQVSQGGAAYFAGKV